MYVIGDVHGMMRTLEDLIAKFPDKNEQIVFVGDLIDRGPMSRQVVEFVRDNGHQTPMGNHEYMMLGSIDRTYKTPFWCRGAWIGNGGIQTLQSYGYTFEQFRDGECVFPDLVPWLRSLPCYLRFPEALADGRDLVVSHACLSDRYTLDTAHKGLEDDYDGILWYRGGCAKDEKLFHVFGHTPERSATLTDAFARIDTGAWSMLTALRFPQMELYQAENVRDKLIGRDF